MKEVALVKFSWSISEVVNILIDKLEIKQELKGKAKLLYDGKEMRLESNDVFCIMFGPGPEGVDAKLIAEIAIRQREKKIL